MYDRKALTRNAIRITKERGLAAIRIRVPGGHLESQHLQTLQKIADEFGDGSLHLTTRQGFELPGIKMEDLPKVKHLMAPMIVDIERASGVELGDAEDGYPAAGVRNVSACIGNRVCPFSNYDTTALANRIEALIYPNDLHVKVACTGCPNDCIKAHMQDYGVIGVTVPKYDESRCISCGACVAVCHKKVTSALQMQNFAVDLDARRCIGCGECTMACPNGALTRSNEKYFTVVIMGRTGRRNPRIARPFLRCVREETVLKVLANVYEFAKKHIDKSLPKEHIGYIVDRTGYSVFRDEVLEGVELGPLAQVAQNITFGGYWYEEDVSFSKQDEELVPGAS